MITRISSRSNPLILSVVKRRRDVFGGEGFFFVEGEKLLTEVIRSPHSIRSVFVLEGSENRLPALPESCSQHLVTPSVMEKLSTLKSPAWVVAECAVAECPGPEKGSFPGPWVVLDALQDPGNLGMIFRSAEAFCQPFLLLVSPIVNPFHDKVIRGSAGASLRVSALRADDPVAACALIRSAGLDIALLEPGGSVSIEHLETPQRFAFVVGNEGHGISAPFQAQAALSVRIPTAARTESLNAAAAASILLYTLNRVARCDNSTADDAT